MKRIQLNPKHWNRFALVDDQDYKALSQFRWGYHQSGGYAARTIQADSKQKTILMHRQILDAPMDKHTDHKNGNGLDNRRSNLRLCSRSENLQNQKLHTNNTSGVRGVDRYKGRVWRVRLQANGKPISLGYCKTLDEAKRLYAYGSLLLHGEYRRPVSRP